MKHLLILTLLTACSTEKHEARQHDGATESLKGKYEIVFSEVEAELEPDSGWPSNSDCDGLLWSSLACTVGLPVKIELAEYSPGEMHRRPYKACYTEKEGDLGSKSTISRDMLTGYMSCLWERKDLAAFQRLADYGEKNEWIMGLPKLLVSRVLLTGNGIGSLGRAIYHLSDRSDDRYYRRLGYLFPKVEADFEKHIQTQGILLQDSIDDAYNLTTAVNQEMLNRLSENAAAYPEDYLFSAALGRFTGDQNRTIELLLKEGFKCSTYVRGERPDIYCKLNWLQAAKIVIGDKR